ncbi:hypothetical protein GCM10009557_56110 [Virgisporangium ochraceum]|uniref:Uncharacterized protein n=1 Tax=Virgisporangium ochraceum TaxID=65505 RepID=A0A8J3ZUR6_9ACTN|nr:hypothetical protein [Virgisporangium ochraceum]GIJ67865.1 hypothetical protein Voc01_027820 [Virgisporangium ochraceum]
MAVIDAPNGTTTWLRRVWPAAFGAVFAAFNTIGLAGGADLAPVLVGSGFVYLGAAALRRRGAAWPVFWLVFVVIGVSRVLDGPDSTWVILGVAAAFAVYGLARGAARDREGLPRQASAMVVVGGLAATALLVGGDLGAYLVAGGLLAHAGWDAYHHRTGKVVTRSMTEFCFVLDVLAAVALIVVAVTR